MTTPNIGLTKPTVGGSSDQWGSDWNTNADLIDARCAKIGFSAYLNTATQSIPNNAATKVTLDAEEFDVGSFFDSATNYRFLPNVAGYYQFNGRVNFDTFTGVGANVEARLYKNGSLAKRGTVFTNGGTQTWAPTVCALVYLNGSTDYVELYCFQQNGGSLNISAGGTAYSTFLTGFLAFPA